MRETTPLLASSTTAASSAAAQSHSQSHAHSHRGAHSLSHSHPHAQGNSHSHSHSHGHGQGNPSDHADSVSTRSHNVIDDSFHAPPQSSSSSTMGAMHSAYRNFTASLRSPLNSPAPSPDSSPLSDSFPHGKYGPSSQYFLPSSDTVVHVREHRYPPHSYGSLPHSQASSSSSSSRQGIKTPISLLTFFCQILSYIINLLLFIVYIFMLSVVFSHIIHPEFDCNHSLLVFLFLHGVAGCIWFVAIPIQERLETRVPPEWEEFCFRSTWCLRSMCFMVMLISAIIGSIVVFSASSASNPSLIVHNAMPPSNDRTYCTAAFLYPSTLHINVVYFSWWYLLFYWMITGIFLLILSGGLLFICIAMHK